MVALAASLGCGGPARGDVAPTAGQAAAAKEVRIYAVDTSMSAVPKHGEFFKQIQDEWSAVPLDEKIYLYRFDSACAEVRSEPVPPTKEGMREILEKTLHHRSQTEGTNLAKLVVQINKKLAGVELPGRILIFTDCGTENMTPEQEEQVRRITTEWNERHEISEVVVVGVDGGYREKLRDLIRLPDSAFRIVDRL